MSGWVKICKAYNAIKLFCIMKTVKVSHPLEVENIARLDKLKYVCNGFRFGA